MLRRIRPRLVIDLARREVPAPVDVINLITPANFDRYRWYGLLVMPALAAVGGRVLWMGRFEREIAGARQAEKLLIVRYPSHRRFLAMVLNPYYFAINLLREAGVRRFEASFTHASHTDPDLSRRRSLVGVHFNSPAGAGALGPIRECFEAAGYQLAYATRASSPLGILEPPRPTDPNPLKFGELALFEAGEDAAPAEQPAAEVAALTDGCSIQAYAREPRSEYRPVLRPAPQVAR
jgi:uncharacterized protein (DUF1330 family)